MASIINRLFGRKSPSYEFTPYSGIRPPRVDYTDASGKPVEILRPTQKQLFDILMARSKGDGVGYAPEWLQLNTDLIKSNLAKQEEDQVRDARGALSSAGLSGNPRAIEATAGRIRRDVGRNLSDSMTQLSISDLERKNQERDVNTARLQDFNAQNFGQENTAANFDLGVYNAEEGNKLNSANFGLNKQGQDDEFLSGLIQAGAMGAGYATGAAPAMQMVSPTVQSLTRTAGTGIQPTLSPSAGMFTQPLKKSAKNLLR